MKIILAIFFIINILFAVSIIEEEKKIEEGISYSETLEGIFFPLAKKENILRATFLYNDLIDMHNDLVNSIFQYELLIKEKDLIIENHNKILQKQHDANNKLFKKNINLIEKQKINNIIIFGVALPIIAVETILIIVLIGNF